MDFNSYFSTQEKKVDIVSPNMDDTDIKATKDNLLSQLEEARKNGKIEKAPTSKYFKKS